MTPSGELVNVLKRGRIVRVKHRVSMVLRGRE